MSVKTRAKVHFDDPAHFPKDWRVISEGTDAVFGPVDKFVRNVCFISLIGSAVFGVDCMNLSTDLRNSRLIEVDGRAGGGVSLGFGTLISGIEVSHIGQLMAVWPSS